MRVFNFDPQTCVARFRENGWLHVAGGASPEFLGWLGSERRRLIGTADSSIEQLHFKGKKKQYLFEFPDESCLPGLLDDLAVITELPREGWMICERHIKVYESDAKAHVPPHKDRLQSELALGFTLEAPEQSHLVLYPRHELAINPFSSTAAWRSGLDEADLPENALRGIEPVRCHVRPGDVHMFRGNCIYHEREHAAGATVMYLKFNSMRLDPLGEDPVTASQRQRSLEILGSWDDEALLLCRLEVSPRLDRISRHYTRHHWREVVQANLWGEKEFTLSEMELRLFTSIERGRTIDQVMQLLGIPKLQRKAELRMFKRLCRLGGIDFLG